MTMNLSFTNKKWILNEDLSEEGDLCHNLLLHREIPAENFHDFLNPSWDHLLDPILMKDMQVSVERIKKAIDEKQRIMVYGDFDADGVTSTIILVGALKELGATVSYRIPSRNKESHGLKKHIIKEIAEKKVDLIVTCDCGTNDYEEIEYAHELGLDIIITDHHHQDLDRKSDKALGIINPHQEACSYPEQYLSGSGVAFKLIQALSSYFFDDIENQRKFLAKYLEISAIGLVTDCVPLKGESRIIASMGIDRFSEKSWKGLELLLERANIHPRDISEETIGFCVGPHINAASRIGNVLEATQLFLSAPENVPDRLKILEGYNLERKRLSQKYIEMAELQVNPAENFQFILMEECLPGILGLIGSRIGEDQNSPAILMVKSGLNIQASCRAPEGYNIIKALKSCDQNLFNMIGGHAGAAGFSIPVENLGQLKKELTTHFESIPKQIVEVPVDAIINPTEISADFMTFLKKMAPFGRSNPAPVFKFKQVKIKEVLSIGKEKNHLKIKIIHPVNSLDENQEVAEVEVLAFFWGKHKKHFLPGQCIDVLFTLGQNTWRNQTRIQFRLIDARKA